MQHTGTRLHTYPSHDSMYRTCTVSYALHCTPHQPYPLHAGPPFPTLERTRLEARKLAQHGYGGWMMRSAGSNSF